MPLTAIFPISEQLVGLSEWIAFPVHNTGVQNQAALAFQTITACKSISCGTLSDSNLPFVHFGTAIALYENADARQKRWGKRFRAVLAEIAGQESGGPPHRTSGLFFAWGKCGRSLYLPRDSARRNILHCQILHLPDRHSISISDGPSRDSRHSLPRYNDTDKV